jgi:hypothetical protein
MQNPNLRFADDGFAGPMRTKPLSSGFPLRISQSLWVGSMSMLKLSFDLNQNAIADRNMGGGIGSQGILDQNLPLGSHALDSKFIHDLPEPVGLGSS